MSSKIKQNLCPYESAGIKEEADIDRLSEVIWQTTNSVFFPGT
jgi:hypothetical protein